jgi:hypothetical protein
MSLLARLLGYEKTDTLQLTRNPALHIFSIVIWGVGGAFAFVMIRNGLETNVDLLEVGVPTTAVDSWYQRRGDLPVIEVDGTQYICGGRSLDPEHRKVTVLYDPDNPDNCHLESDIGEREYYDAILGAVSGLFVLGLGLKGLLEPRSAR